MSFTPDTPIEEMLTRAADINSLTDSARNMTKADVMFMASDMQTPATINLTSKDVNSIKRAFSHDRHVMEEQKFGSSDDTSCCCTPCCCATAVVKPVSKVA